MTAMKATRQAVIARCKELGVVLHDSGENIYADCPTGKVFSLTGCHMIDRNYATRGQRHTPAAEVWQSVLDDMAEGFSDCNDTDCDYCTEGHADSYPWMGERLA